MSSTAKFESGHYRTTVPCRICSEPTHMHGTKLCDRCWELDVRIKSSPEVARKILDQYEQEAKCR